MGDFLDTIKLIADADLSKASAKIKEFGSTSTSELRKVETGAGSSGSAAGGAFSDQFQKATLAGFAAVNAAVATLGGIRFLEGAVQDAVELARAEASLSAQVKDVGATAGVTTGSLDRLATTVQGQQAIFAGTVKGGEALLLTFHEIRNEAGAGNDIFNRTITTAGALANVFGTDLNTQVVQLGRALENPLTGILALQRAKIALPEGIKEQVKTLAQQGDLLGAQRVLLDELEGRYVSAGAAIAKADPFQQFSVSLKTFKTDVGKDFLPIATELLGVASSLLEGFDKLPAPIKDTAEALAAVALAAAPLLALHSGLEAVTALRAAVSGGSTVETVATAATSATSGATRSEAAAAGAAAETEYRAALDASIATEQLAIQSVAELGGARIAELEAELALYSNPKIIASIEAEIEGERQLIALQGELAAARLEGAAAATAEADATFANSAANTENAVSGTASKGGVLAALGPIGIGAVAGLAGLGIINHFTNPSHEKFNELVGDLDRVKSAIDHQAHNEADALFHFSSAKQAKADLDDLNKGFTDLLDAQGPDRALASFNSFLQKLQAAGGDVSQTDTAFRGFLQSLSAVQAQEAAAAKNTDDLSVSFAALSQQLDKESGALTIADDFRSISDAQDKVKEDYKDLIGTSDKARKANEDVANSVRGVRDANEHVADSHLALQDSYRKLKDAQDKVTESTKTLKDAQSELDAFNSPRGAEERALKLDILKRRVVTTPGDFDQKQLDLLQNEDANNKKRADLTDAVTRAQKGLSDAIRGVADAQHGIVTAERGVRDATEAVATANQKVADAVVARRKVHDDAAKAIDGDEAKVLEAILKTKDAIDQVAAKTGLANDQIVFYGTLLKGLGDSVGGPIKKAFDNYYDDVIAKQKKFNELTGGSGRPGPASAPQGTYGRPGTPSGNTSSVPGSNTTPGSNQPPHAADGAIFSASEGVKYKFNEPEAGGEALIPLGGAKRVRATTILKTVAGMFGLSLAKTHGFADGGLVDVPNVRFASGPDSSGGSAGRAGSWNAGVKIEQTNHFSSGTALSDLDYANRELGWRLSRTGR